MPATVGATLRRTLVTTLLARRPHCLAHLTSAACLAWTCLAALTPVVSISCVPLLHMCPSATYAPPVPPSCVPPVCAPPLLYSYWKLALKLLFPVMCTQQGAHPSQRLAAKQPAKAKQGDWGNGALAQAGTLMVRGISARFLFRLLHASPHRSGRSGMGELIFAPWHIILFHF